MSILTLQGVVRNGRIRLDDGVLLPEKSRVYVVVPDTPESAAHDNGDEASQTEKTRLAEKQFRLASQYPGDYVVLVGERTIHHSPDRQEAVATFQRAARAFPPHRPVFIRPGGRLRKPPVVRGRSMSGKLRKRQ